MIHVTSNQKGLRSRLKSLGVKSNAWKRLGQRSTLPLLSEAGDIQVSP